MEVQSLCSSCVCNNVCRHNGMESRWDHSENLAAGIEFGVVKCPHHVAVPFAATAQAMPVDRPFRPNLNQHKADTVAPETVVLPEIMEKPEVTPKNCMVCGAETTLICETCEKPLCENCATEDMATGKMVCPVCWDAEPGAIIKNSGVILHVQ